jgi:hypothetical protein
MVLRCSIAAAVLSGVIAFGQSSEPAQSSQAPQTSESSQSAQPDSAASPQSTPAESPGQNSAASELVRSVVSNELKAADQDHSHWMYQLDTQKAGTRETSEVIETKDGNVTRLVERNGKPLTPEEQKSEDEKIEKFIGDPAEQQKQQRDESDDARKMKALLSLLPKALNYSAPMTSGDTATMKFEPNPSFHPPSREAHVFHEMEGELAVDTKQRRIVEFSGHLIHAVDFGGGLLGHLDEGGTFDVRQEEVSPNYWEIALLKINMKGKALLFKTVSVQQDEKHSNFRRVSDTLTLAQGFDLLRKQTAPK